MVEAGTDDVHETVAEFEVIADTTGTDSIAGEDTALGVRTGVGVGVRDGTGAEASELPLAPDTRIANLQEEPQDKPATVILCTLPTVAGTGSLVILDAAQKAVYWHGLYWNGSGVYVHSVTAGSLALVMTIFLLKFKFGTIDLALYFS